MSKNSLESEQGHTTSTRYTNYFRQVYSVVQLSTVIELVTCCQSVVVHPEVQLGGG